MIQYGGLNKKMFEALSINRINIIHNQILSSENLVVVAAVFSSCVFHSLEYFRCLTFVRWYKPNSIFNYSSIGNQNQFVYVVLFLLLKIKLTFLPFCP